MRIKFAVLCAVIAACLAVWVASPGDRGSSRPPPRPRRQQTRLAPAVPAPASFREWEAAAPEGEIVRAMEPLEVSRPAAGETAKVEAIAKRGDDTEGEAKSRSWPAREAARAKFFSGPVPRISIRLPRESARALSSNPRSYVLCTVVADGKTHDKVGIHLKGAAGSFRQLRERPGLTLNFKRFPEGKLFHGMRKIHLNNSIQDPSLLSEIICSEAFLASGVPAARATHARVELDGRDLGLYVLVEGMDAGFLERHFGSHDGSLYDGGFCQDVTGRMHQLSGEKENAMGARNLIAAATERDMDLRWKRLGQVLDLDRFITFMAIEVMVWDWDGYVLKPNNFRLHQDASSGRITFLPHGMDQMFQSPDGSILQGMAGLVARAVMECPEGKERYIQKMIELHPKVFALPEISKRIDGLLARAAEAFSDIPQMAARVRMRAESFRRQIEARARSVEQQLSSRPRPLHLDAEGRADLGSAAWTPRLDSQDAFAQELTVGGRRELILRARGSDASALASYRLAVSLPPGRYRLEGRARTSGVEAFNDKKGEGAGLRISGTKTPRANGLKDDSEWTDLHYDFEVAGGTRDVTLVAELRARSGEAHFDAGAMRLVKEK